ncbi:unnamed protein product, partial [Effrenium voratum]
METRLGWLPLPLCALQEIGAGLGVAGQGRAPNVSGVWAQAAAAQAAQLENAMAGAATTLVHWPCGLAAPADVDFLAKVEADWNIAPGHLAPNNLLADYLDENWGTISWRAALARNSSLAELGMLGDVLRDASLVLPRLHGEHMGAEVAGVDAQFGLVVHFFWQTHEAAFFVPEIFSDPIGLGAMCRRARSSAVCDYERMETECLAASGRRSILQRLKAMADDNLRGIALELTPAEFRGHFQRGLASAQRFCLGFDGEASAACFFCDPEAVAAKVDAPGGRREVAGLLQQLSPAAKAKALAERIPEDARREILEALHHGAAARRPRSQASPSELQERWAPGLAQRQSAKAPATAAQKKAYREQVLADRARGRKHAGRIPERAARGAEVSNSPPVPPAKRSAKAAGLERWALRNAWAQCRACGQMLPRDLTQKALARAQKVTAPSSQCPR